MTLFEDTNPKALKTLLSEIHSRTTVLPDFQRDFVWDPNATQELIVSIANNYPAGSLLRVRDKSRVFAARQFEGAPDLDGHPHIFLVLDGQQRLTSLYQAFYGKGEHRYYLNLRRLIDGEDFEDAVFHMREKTKWVQTHEEFAVQAKELILPLSILEGGYGGFLKWLFAATNPLPPEERATMIDALTEICGRWIQTIDDYQFPVVTLSDDTEPAALCTIFETLNRTGVKLSVFELLTARFWPHDIQLRDWWEVARTEHPLIAEFEVDPYYVLQAIALASRTSPSCKRNDVLNLTADDIREWWGRTIDGLAAGLGILRDDCKVMLPKWLPYQTMLPTLAAVLARAGVPKTPEAGAHRELLKRWFWCAVFGQAYESAPNSQAAKDVAELLAWFGGGQAPECVRLLRFDPEMLRRVTPRQRSVYRGAICLVLASGKGARDFHTQGVITTQLILTEGIDDHHVFPDDFLQKKQPNPITDAQKRDCVLNRTLIDAATNRMISNRAPSDYMREIRDTPNFPFNEVLESHCLPTGDTSPFWTDDYEAFLTWRQSRLWQEIKRVTGLVEAADLEADEAAVA